MKINYFRVVAVSLVLAVAYLAARTDASFPSYYPKADHMRLLTGRKAQNCSSDFDSYFEIVDGVLVERCTMPTPNKAGLKVIKNSDGEQELVFENDNAASDTGIKGLALLAGRDLTFSKNGPGTRVLAAEYAYKQEPKKYKHTSYDDYQSYKKEVQSKYEEEEEQEQEERDNYKKTYSRNGPGTRVYYVEAETESYEPYESRTSKQTTDYFNYYRPQSRDEQERDRSYDGRRSYKEKEMKRYREDDDRRSYKREEMKRSSEYEEKDRYGDNAKYPIRKRNEMKEKYEREGYY